MLKSFLGKWHPQSHPHQSPGQGCRGSEGGNPDREEDGFLLVGDTASERNTVMPPHLAVQPPPSYETQVQYAAFQSHGQTSPHGHWSSASRPALSPPAQSHPPVSHASPAQVSSKNSKNYAAIVVADIPFRLSEELDLAQKLSVDMSYFAVPRLPSYDPGKYDYDFNYERRVLRETSEYGT